MGYNQGGGFGQNYSNRRTNYNQDFSQTQRSNNGYQYQPQRQVKKHSGCKTGILKAGNFQGEQYVSGWNYSKAHGLRSFLATPYSKTKKSISKKTGTEWLNVVVKVQPKQQKAFLVSGMLEVRTNRVIIEELGMIMNPKAPNGGYCGTMFQNKR